MRLVIDANILLAGLLRDSVTRALILNARLELFAPVNLRTETERRLVDSSRFRRRLQLSKKELQWVLSYLLSYTTIVSEKQFALYMPLALQIAPRPEDASYIALALTLKIPVWSNDAGLRRQETVEVVTTAELISSFSNS